MDASRASTTIRYGLESAAALVGTLCVVLIDAASRATADEVVRFIVHVGGYGILAAASAAMHALGVRTIGLLRVPSIVAMVAIVAIVFRTPSASGVAATLPIGLGWLAGIVLFEQIGLNRQRLMLLSPPARIEAEAVASVVAVVSIVVMTVGQFAASAWTAGPVAITATAYWLWASRTSAIFPRVPLAAMVAVSVATLVHAASQRSEVPSPVDATAAVSGVLITAWYVWMAQRAS